MIKEQITTPNVATANPTRIGLDGLERRKAVLDVIIDLMSKKEKNKKKRLSKFFSSFHGENYDIGEALDYLYWLKSSNTMKNKIDEFWETVPLFEDYAGTLYDDDIQKKIEELAGQKFEDFEAAFEWLMSSNNIGGIESNIAELCDIITSNAYIGEDQEWKLLTEAGMTHKTPIGKLMYQKKMYRLHRTRIKARQKKMNHLLAAKKKSRDKQNRTLVKGDRKKKNRRSAHHTNEAQLLMEAKSVRYTQKGTRDFTNKYGLGPCGAAAMILRDNGFGDIYYCMFGAVDDYMTSFPHYINIDRAGNIYDPTNVFVNSQTIKKVNQSKPVPADQATYWELDKLRNNEDPDLYDQEMADFLRPYFKF